MTRFSLQNQNEHALIRAVGLGNESAFQDIFNKYSKDVFHFSLSLLLDHQSAEDVTQETFVKLWKNAKNWKPDAHIKTWLIKVARNTALDKLRKNKTTKKLQNELQNEFINSETNIFSKDDYESDAETQVDFLKNKIFLLSERQREAIMLVYYSEFTNIQASQIMNLSESAFDSLLARARKNLRDTLKNKQFELKESLYGR